MRDVCIAILGLGTVGQGVLKGLKENSELMLHQTGCAVRVKKILLRNPEKYSYVELPEGAEVVTDFQHILDDEEIQIVIEVMGGTTFAKDCMERSILAGKHVVTANKDVMAMCGQQLIQLAEDHGVDFFFEASVAGGIPIIRPLYNSLWSNQIESIVGIMNGTTNYILSRMTAEGLSFEEALRGAQEKGYAEADPTADVEGYDAGRKIAILGMMGFHTGLTFEDVTVEGITKITAKDIKEAAELGFVIKLLGVAKETKKGISLNVYPCLLSKHHPLAAVSGAYNAVYVTGNCVGSVMFYGQGAGSLPTASSVLADVMLAAHHIERGKTGHNHYYWKSSRTIYSPLKITSPYYFRITVDNAPGVLASIASVFAEYRISIRSLIQRDESKEMAEIIIVTDETEHGSALKAASNIEKLICVRNIENMLRVMEAEE